MKKLIIASVLLVSLVLFAGCGGQQPAQTAPSSGDSVADSGDATEGDTATGDTVAGSGDAMEGDITTENTASGSEGALEGELAEGAPEGAEQGTCGTEAVITIRGCEATDDLTNVIVKFQNNGRGDLEGILFKVLNQEDEVIEETSEMAAFAIGETREYTLDLSGSESLGMIDAYPISNNVICANQRNRFNPDNCS